MISKNLLFWAAALATVFTASSLQAQPQDSRLNEMLRQVLKDNPQLQRARQEWKLAGLEEPGLLANTDPVLSASLVKSEDWSPTAAPSFSGRRSIAEQFELGYAQKWLTGTQAGLAWTADRVDNDAPFRLANELYGEKLRFFLRQPVLKNTWGRPDKSLRTRARKNVESAQYKFHAMLEQVAFDFAQHYLELQFAAEHLDIKRSKQENLKRLLKKQKEKNDYGLNEASDILQTQAALSLADLEVEAAQAAIAVAQNNVRAFISSEWKKNESGAIAVSSAIILYDFVPAEKPETLWRNRFEIAALSSALDSLQADIRIARLNFLPSLDIVASLQGASLNTTGGQAEQDLFARGKPYYTVGLEFSVPFGHKMEKNSLENLEVRLRAMQAEMENSRLKIMMEIRNQQENYRLAKLRTRALQDIQILQQKKLIAEEKLFSRGRSNTDILIRFENDLNQSQSDLLRAKIDQNKAALATALACGEILSTLHIKP